MAVLKPRERLVYFRISEDEFRQFVTVCEQEGARSVSDLARSAVQRLISDGYRHREDDEMAEKMHRLERLIEAVTEQLVLLSASQATGSPAGKLIKRAHEFASETTLVDRNGGREQ